MSVVVDTGVLLAAADADDDDHEVCARLLREHRGKLWVPAPVIPKCAWQVERNVGSAAEAAFLRHMASERRYQQAAVPFEWKFTRGDPGAAHEETGRQAGLPGRSLSLPGYVIEIMTQST